MISNREAQIGASLEGEMKAIVLRELGEPENLKLEDAPDPQPGPNEVVVRLKAAALNHRDVWIRRGLYAGIRLPIILGSDGAGEVAAVGAGVDPSLVGRAVVIDPSLDWGPDERVQGPNYRILGLPDDGTHAEMIKVPASNVHPKPEALSFEEAAAIPLAGLTAYRAVVSRARVQSGETVLVTGIGGGVSSFALQIATRLGARVFVTSGSDEKLARARELGAAGGANYRTQDWGKEITALTGHGPDVVIDSVGGETFNKAIEIVKPGGRIVTYGATTGPAPKVEVRRIFFKQLNILGSTMGHAREFADMLKLYEGGELRPVVDKVFPLAEAAAAHQRMEEAGQFGKIVLRIE
jgi:zinc-binding alcohol dehydrogenase/oxidoreductase